MAYCTNTDVLAEFKNLSWNSATLSSTDVDEFISQEDAYINSKVGLKYVVPLTTTEALKIAKKISIWLVADRVADILKLKTGKQELQQNQVPGQREATLKEKADKMLTAIVKNELLLSDATLVRSSGGFESYTADLGTCHTFKLDCDQW